MTNIKQLKDRKANETAEKKQEILNLSMLRYNEQLRAINWIVKTEWYKEIKKFWILQEKQAMELLKNVRFSDLQEFWRVQARANISEEFITFLNNLES